MLVSPLTYTVGATNVQISVPTGFVTDFASTPRPLWAAIPPHGRYGRAAVIHDYLYWTQSCTKDQADNILLIAMKESGVDSATLTAIYEGVHLFGASAWNEDAAERARGLPKFIPDNYINFDGDTDWPTLREKLVKDGVRDPQFPMNPSYCSIGDAQVVP